MDSRHASRCWSDVSTSEACSASARTCSNKTCLAEGLPLYERQARSNLKNISISEDPYPITQTYTTHCQQGQCRRKPKQQCIPCQLGGTSTSKGNTYQTQLGACGCMSQASKCHMLQVRQSIVNFFPPKPLWAQSSSAIMLSDAFSFMCMWRATWAMYSASICTTRLESAGSSHYEIQAGV